MFQLEHFSGEVVVPTSKIEHFSGEVLKITAAWHPFPLPRVSVPRETGEPKGVKTIEVSARLSEGSRPDPLSDTLRRACLFARENAFLAKGDFTESF